MTAVKRAWTQLSQSGLIDEDTVLPAVALWWRVLDDERAQSEIDHIGSGAMATDWGARIISNRSQLYDPLSYHYGSVWPLFTGWAAMGAYRYGRPHVGYQALMANALLTYEGALGYVTELLSGDFNAAFGRSSHHQVWSEAMVVTPALRGLLGVEISAGGRGLSFAPQFPANWDRVAVRNVAAGDARYDLSLERTAGQESVKIVRRTVQQNSTVDQKIDLFDANNCRACFPARCANQQGACQWPRGTVPSRTHGRRATRGGQLLRRRRK